MGIAIEVRGKNWTGSGKGYRLMSEYTRIGYGAVGIAIECKELIAQA